jgi:hypothetical protein
MKPPSVIDWKWAVAPRQQSHSGATAHFQSTSPRVGRGERCVSPLTVPGLYRANATEQEPLQGEDLIALTELNTY